MLNRRENDSQLDGQETIFLAETGLEMSLKEKLEFTQKPVKQVNIGKYKPQGQVKGKRAACLSGLEG